MNMPIFDCTPEKLAELFSANTGLYNSLLSSLRALQKRGVLDKGLEATLKEDLKIIFKAGQVSTSSSYFAFNTYDSWAERQSGLSEGMTLYQHVNGRLIEKLGLSSNGVPSEETITTFLKKESINLVYTGNLPLKGYGGLEPDYTDDDGDAIQREPLENYQREILKESGIKVLDFIFP